ncbi:Retinoic acid induced 16-like protein-domain-containing protein [Gaertneriomyces semiglobifer]|nr:Retinoic acid induced 16-like protein-domain-containing protein [Gaertneriomyces semiglobifer]
MDFFSRIKAKVEAITVTQDDLFDKFRTCWHRIVRTYQEGYYDVDVADTDIPTSLQRMIDILLKEQNYIQRPDMQMQFTGICAEEFLNKDMLGQLVTMSEHDRPFGFRREVINFLSSLVSLLEGQSLFHKSINGAAALLMKEDSKWEVAILELESNIATKIHELPPLLNLFFYQPIVPKNVPASAVSSSSVGGLVGSSEGHNPTYTFPLFDHMIRYLHMEGRLADIARASCLLLLEVPAKDMHQYVSRTDFAAICVAGIGGAFSQLPHQLPPLGHNPATSNSYGRITFARDVESMLEAVRFVESIVRVTDVNPDAHAVRDNVLSEFRTGFLEAVIKPMFENGSDFDGSVISLLHYLTRVLETLQDGHASRILIEFLLGSDDGIAKADQSISEEQVVGSENEPGAEDEDDPSGPVMAIPAREVSLRLQPRDILLSKLSSLSEEVVQSILQFFQQLLSPAHRDRSLPLLFEPLQEYANGTSGVDYDTVNGHLNRIKRYFGLVGSVEGFEEYLADAEMSVALHESHAAPVNNVADEPADSLSDVDTPLSPAPPVEPASEPHPSIARLANDVTLQKFLLKLRTFFSHSFRINLALTGFLSALASAAPAATLYIFLFDGDLEMDRLKTETAERVSFFTLLQALYAQVSTRRPQIPDFDERLAFIRDQVKNSQSSGSIDFDATFDSETEFMKNVVVLEEFAKELLATMVMREGGVQIGHL